MDVAVAFTHIAIIFNPNSTGNAAVNARRLEAELKVSFPRTPVTLLATKYARHAQELAYDFAMDHKRAFIISASGDGGYNEVVNGALRAQEEGSQPLLAVLASGNANDHARTVQPRPLPDMIRSGKISRLDALEMTYKQPRGVTIHRFAHSYIGVGLTPKVAVELNRTELNTFKESWLILKTLFQLRPVSIKMSRRIQVLDSMICSVIPEMAKILTVDRKAHPRDGKFEVAIFDHTNKLVLLLRLLKGATLQMGAAHRKRTISFELLKPSPIQLDGEVVWLPKNTRVTITIRPKLLRSVASV